MKIMMCYNSISSDYTLYKNKPYWSEKEQKWISTPVEISHAIEAESIEKLEEKFKSVLTKNIKYWIDTGDYITFDFHMHSILIPDFYPLGKYEPYTEDRKPFPKFLLLDEWFDKQIDKRKMYYGMIPYVEEI